MCRLRCNHCIETDTQVLMGGKESKRIETKEVRLSYTEPEEYEFGRVWGLTGKER